MTSPPNLWLPNATAPLLASTRVTQLDAALRIGLAGPWSFFQAVMDSWLRRHDVVAKPSNAYKRPRRRHAIDRLFLALMRFVFGFFGSHKVDARNNPRRSSCNYSGVLRETPRPS